jgi:hypothetical protein
MRWHSIPGYEGIYEISEIGHIRRMCDSHRAPDGYQKRHNTSRKGYNTTVLARDGVNRSFTVHRLVALVFIGPRPNGRQINHKDGVKTNNDWRNLEYVTCKENIRHAAKSGLRGYFKGTANGCAKVTEDDIRAIRKAYASGESQPSIGRRYGLTQANVSYIVLRRTWSHVI